MALFLLHETIWFEKYKYDDAESQFYENRMQNNSGGQRTLSKSAQKRAKKQRDLHLTQQEVSAESSPAVASSVKEATKGSLADEIAKARKHIQKSLQTPNVSSVAGSVDGSGDAHRRNIDARLASIEQEALLLKQGFSEVTKSLQNVLSKLEGRISILENMLSNSPAINVATTTKTVQVQMTQAAIPSPQAAPPIHKPEPLKAETNGMKDDDDDVDLFGSDDEDDEEAEKLRNDRLKAYEEKKAKKPVLIAKSNIILDVKPWDDETDMIEVEKCVRSVKTDGLLWGASKLVPLAYGIKKLQISCVVEDDKVGTDYLEETITAFEELVQSVDIVAFNKI